MKDEVKAGPKGRYLGGAPRLLVISYPVAPFHINFERFLFVPPSCKNFKWLFFTFDESKSKSKGDQTKEGAKTKMILMIIAKIVIMIMIMVITRIMIMIIAKIMIMIIAKTKMILMIIAKIMIMIMVMICL